MRAFLEGVAGLELRKIICQPIPARWMTFTGRTELQWTRYPFDAAAFSRIPSEPGFYCFVVGPPPSTLPQVTFPMYLGKTERTLQIRFGEYLREQHDANGRLHVRKFLQVFEGELDFMCTVFRGTHQEVVDTERALLDAMMPSYSDSGYSAEIRAGRGAWQ